jgi:hypothetical protein
MSDPIGRLELAKTELDRVFHPGFAEANPVLLTAAMNAASSDYLALTLARAICNAAERIADALAEPEEAQQHIVPARELLRPRP